MAAQEAESKSIFSFLRTRPLALPPIFFCPTSHPLQLELLKLDQHPNQTTRCGGFGREKQALNGIPQTGLATRTRKNIILNRNGQDVAGNDIPFIVYGNRNDRLNI